MFVLNTPCVTYFMKSSFAVLEAAIRVTSIYIIKL